MAALVRRKGFLPSVKKLINISKFRGIRTGNVCLVKEIQHEDKGGVTEIKGVFVKSPREGNVIEAKDRSMACPLCRLGIENLAHTDVLILSQFMDTEGGVIPQSVTGLCNKQHIMCQGLITKAQKAGLLPKKNQSDDPTANEGWRKPNTYFKSYSTIKHMDNRRNDKTFKKPY